MNEALLGPTRAHPIAESPPQDPRTESEWNGPRYRAMLIDPDGKRHEPLQAFSDVYEDLERWSRFALADASPNATVEIFEIAEVLIYRVSQPRAEVA